MHQEILPWLRHYENKEVIFLPLPPIPNMTLLLQSVDQGVIATFKDYYLWKIFAKLIQATDGKNKPTVNEFWKCLNIQHAIDNLAKTSADVSQFCMNRVQKKFLPHISWFLRLGAGQGSETLSTATCWTIWRSRLWWSRGNRCSWVVESEGKAVTWRFVVATWRACPYS